MNDFWEITNDPWDTYANWESWLAKQMPDFIVDKICEVDVVLMANIYGVFCGLRDNLENKQDK